MTHGEDMFSNAANGDVASLETGRTLEAEGGPTGAIPRRIIQTGRDRTLPPLFRASTANVRLLNPEFEYSFFDDAGVDAFVQETFPEFAAVFGAFRYRIQQIDFFRYLAVYHFGGFYLDLDVLLYRGLSDLLSRGCVFPFERLGVSKFLQRKYNQFWDLGNYAFAAQPGDPFLEKVIENCCRAQRDPSWVNPVLKSIPPILRPDSYVLSTTGPLLVTRTFAENPALHAGIHLLLPEDICDKKYWNKFGEYGLHLINSSWRPRGNSLYKVYRMIWRYVYLKTEKKTIAAAKVRRNEPRHCRRWERGTIPQTVLEKPNSEK